MTDPDPVIQRRAPCAEMLAGLNPVVARVMARRGVRTHEELDPSLSGLPAPTLVDIDAATARLEAALRANEHILVVGDFDADGATSVALAVRALRLLGHASVDYLVPNRFEYGYGLTAELVHLAAERQPGLIVTVDNGVASHAGVAAASDHGIDTIVTDHHLPGPTLPPAYAVVNPNREDCGFPGKALAGVGVVFYLMVALRARLQAGGWFAERAMQAPALAALLDLVALGTVADVVPLDRCNRILVEQGLRRIRAGQACAGILALFRAARRDPAASHGSDIGYAIAPRLNAAGRLADMDVGIQALLTDDPATAERLTERLESLNQERRAIESEMRGQAEGELERLRDELTSGQRLPVGVVLHDPRWHQGVIGILAGRLREALHRPTVAFADAGSGALKGSARSVPGLHVRDVLAAIDAAEPGLIQRFGGHAMAAGLTIAAADLEQFRRCFAAQVERALGGVMPFQEILTDGPLGRNELALETAHALAAAGPWGPGFPEPQFDGRFRIVEARTVGQSHLKLRVTPLDEAGPTLDAILFRADPALLADPGEAAELVYRLEVNEFRGRSRVQLVVEHLLPLAAQANRQVESR